jgi:hypothetical protein
MAMAITAAATRKPPARWTKAAVTLKSTNGDGQSGVEVTHDRAGQDLRVDEGGQKAAAEQRADFNAIRLYADQPRKAAEIALLIFSDSGASGGVTMYKASFGSMKRNGFAPA